jgi:hypothetical protein
MGGLMYSMAAHHTDHSSTSCPLCSTLWAALVRHVDKKHSYARGSYQEGREKRLAALRGDPVLVFLNPLCLDERNEEFGTLPYQLCELSVWSSTRENLDTIELYQERYDEEYSYRLPVLKKSMGMASNQIRHFGTVKSKRRRAVLTGSFVLKTSWGG